LLLQKSRPKGLMFHAQSCSTIQGHNCTAWHKAYGDLTSIGALPFFMQCFPDNA